MIVMIDNYDSFTFNVVDLFASLTTETFEVVRNDEFEPASLLATKPRAVLISPGPGDPHRAGRIIELIQTSSGTPLLGICLGHQAIGAAFGAAVVRSKEPVHGKRNSIRHAGTDLFEGVADPLVVTRYHSLEIDRETLPPSLLVEAETEDGVVMAVRHADLPIFGLQFHPESYGSEGGAQIARNFLRIGGLDD
jgi:anthranilate synthase component II